MTAWSYAFFVGSSLLIALRAEVSDSVEPPEPCDLLVATAAGISCTILLVFLIAAIKLLFFGTLLVSLAILAAASFVLAASRVSRSYVLAAMRAALMASARPAFLIILLVCIVLAAPALLPPSLFDDTMYHLPYALDWVKSGGLMVDPYLRFPLAQFNIELLYATAFALQVGPYVQFVTWLFFALTATGIVNVTASAMRAQGATSKIADSVGFLTACVFISCPLVLRFDDVAYVDIPVGAMLLAFAAAAFRAKRAFRSYGIAMAIIGGSFCGTKLSMAPLLIVLSFIIFWYGRSARASNSRVLITLAVFGIFASPWFVRNALVSGDPLDPILNLAIHHTDPYWNQTDLDAQKSDLFVPVQMLTIPVRIFADPTFSGDSVSLSFVLLYVPFLAFMVLLLRKRIREALPDYAICVVLVMFVSIDELLVTNHYARYILHFYALFLVTLVLTVWLCTNWLTERFSSTLRWLPSAATFLAIVAFAVPSPGAINYYDLVRSDFANIAFGLQEPRAYLSRIDGFSAADELANIVSASQTGENVLDVQYPNLAYFFRVRNVESIGDWFGPGRLSDIARAIDNGGLEGYFSQRKIGAIMISSEGHPFSPTQAKTFFAKLPLIGFREITEPASDVREFVKSTTLALAARRGVAIDALDAESSVDFAERSSDGKIGFGPKADYHKGDRTAFVLPVLFDGQYRKSVTVISGYTISFSPIKTSSESVLSFDVAKDSWQGKPAIAWVDVATDGKSRRVFSKVMPLAIGDDPLWTHVSLPLRSRGKEISLTFGAGSTAGGGTADWISYVRPRLTHAMIERTNANAKS